MSLTASPAALGYRMPAEWEPHAATWIAWPHQRDDWPGKFAPIPWVYSEIVRHLSRSERVRILVQDVAEERKARRKLERAGADLSQVDYILLPTDRAWVRDTGAILVKNAAGDLAALNWQFNGWAKYDNHQHDELVGGRMADYLGLRRWRPECRGLRVVLEGGSIEVDGSGLVLTTEECLLSPVQARNPQLAKEEIEKVLCDYLGVVKVLWLGRGIAGDDTHGHIDDLARFVAPGTVVAVVEDDRGDENHAPLQENLERLRGMTDQEGRPLEVHTLPMPAPRYFDRQRLPASYANFTIANDRVLVPTFNDPRDRQAVAKLSELFPDRTVVGIHAVDLVWGLGTLHCLTQQEPKAGSVGGLTGTDTALAP